MLVWVQVPSPAVGRSGGIGRRARFRSVWWQHHEGSSPFFCMTDSPVQRCAGFLLYSDSINSGINLRKTGLQFKWNCAILLFVGEKIIGQRKLKNSKRECWNWQTGKTKDLVGVCSCGFKSHLPQWAEVAELADAHGSGPCDGNIMRVQVPSSAWSIARYRDVPGFVLLKK